MTATTPPLAGAPGLQSLKALAQELRGLVWLPPTDEYTDAGGRYREIRTSEGDVVIGEYGPDRAEAAFIAAANPAVILDLIARLEAVAPQSVSVPEGWKPVPIEPTQKMLDEIWHTSYPETYQHYQRLLAAAPLPQPQADADCMLLESDEADGIEWGVSFCGPNPQPEDYIACKDKESALRLFDKLSASPVSVPPHQGEGSIDTPSLDEVNHAVRNLKEYRSGRMPFHKTNVDILERFVSARLARTAAPSEHPDDLAVDRFATAMKARMAQKRAEGRSGWERPDECSIESLKGALGRTPVWRPVDIGNYAMMLWNRAQPAVAAPAPLEAQPIPTDLSKRLREEYNYLLTNRIGCATLNRDDVLAAAEEIDRYYGRMLNWKKTAEATDRDIEASRIRKVITALIDAASCHCESGEKSALATALEDADNLAAELVYGGVSGLAKTGGAA